MSSKPEDSWRQLNLTDTHCHLDLEAFDNDREALIDRALETGVRRILIPSLNGVSSHKVTSLCASNEHLFAAIGYHPTEAGSWERNSASQLRETYFGSLRTPDNSSGQATENFKGINLSTGEIISKEPNETSKINKIVAVGEIGLDYYWDTAPHELQKLVLLQQLNLARELNLPVILHSREKNDAEQGDCMDDLIDLLRNWINEINQENNVLAKSPGVLHSFSGSLEAARTAIEMNFMIGVTGSITHPKANRRREMIASLPLNRILIETDAPFQSPTPQRGKRNEPAFVRYIADKIAEIHMTTPEIVAEHTTNNAARLFSWGSQV